MNMICDIFNNYEQSQIQSQTETLINLTACYTFYKIIINIILPIIIIIGIFIICYRLKKINTQLEEQNENIEALVKLGIVNNRNN